MIRVLVAFALLAYLFLGLIPFACCYVSAQAGRTQTTSGDSDLGAT